MGTHEASRTLLKSPPELWAECSNAASLARHLGQFGEIRITKLEPETAVAWEGSAARGTVRLEPAGWGTKVFLTATENAAPAVPEPGADAAVEPEPEPGPRRRRNPSPSPRPRRCRSREPGAARPRRSRSPQLSWRPRPNRNRPVRRGFFSRLMSRFQGRRRGHRGRAGSRAAVRARAATRPPRWPRRTPGPSAGRAGPGPSAAAPDPQPATVASALANPLDAALDSLGSAHHRPVLPRLTLLPSGWQRPARHDRARSRLARHARQGTRDLRREARPARRSCVTRRSTTAPRPRLKSSTRRASTPPASGSRSCSTRARSRSSTPSSATARSTSTCRRTGPGAMPWSPATGPSTAAGCACSARTSPCSAARWEK